MGKMLVSTLKVAMWSIYDQLFQQKYIDGFFFDQGTHFEQWKLFVECIRNYEKSPYYCNKVNVQYVKTFLKNHVSEPIRNGLLRTLNKVKQPQDFKLFLQFKMKELQDFFAGFELLECVVRGMGVSMIYWRFEIYFFFKEKLSSQKKLLQRLQVMRTEKLQTISFVIYQVLVALGDEMRVFLDLSREMNRDLFAREVSTLDTKTLNKLRYQATRARPFLFQHEKMSNLVPFLKKAMDFFETDLMQILDFCKDARELDIDVAMNLLTYWIQNMEKKSHYLQLLSRTKQICYS